ncbi:MAG TPA: PKD domain-containing protein [Bacteroidia bacterium]|nr:PKD domain-containing protein [Bacteroidia bacterium]
MKNLKYIFFQAMVAAFALPAFGQTYVGHSLNQAPLLVADGGPNFNFCLGDSVQLGGNPSGIGGTAPLAYSWTPQNVLNSATVPNPIAGPTATTMFTLQVIDAQNCAAAVPVIATLVTSTAAFSATPNLLSVAFSDQSTNATAWSWTFGDGGTSTAQNPSHTYSTGGSYQVCLTVNAGTGCEQTFCDSVNVVAVGVENPAAGSSVQVYPNPSSNGWLNFEVQGIKLEQVVAIELLDLQGRLVMRHEGDASQARHALNCKQLAAGTYQYQVRAGERLLGTGKVVLQ